MGRVEVEEHQLKRELRAAVAAKSGAAFSEANTRTPLRFGAPLASPPLVLDVMRTLDRASGARALGTR